MKKILISAAVILAALFVIHACTREGEEKHEAPQTAKAEAFEQLNVLIDNYTQTFFEQHGAAITRSPEIGDYNPAVPEIERKKRWFVWLVVACDAIGGAIGAIAGLLFGGNVVGGAAAAAAAFSGLVASQNPDRYIETDSNDFSPLQYYNGINGSNLYDYVGIAHNQILSNITQKYGDEFFNTATSEEVYNKVIEETAKLNPDMDALPLTYQETMNTFNKIYEALLTGDINNVVEAIADDYPEMENEAIALCSFLNDYLTIEDKESGNNFVSGYRDLIMASDIPAESKATIQSSISTAVGSNALWQVSVQD